MFFCCMERNMLFNDNEIVDINHLEIKQTFFWDEFHYNSGSGGSSPAERGQSAATRFAEAAKKSSIFKRPTDAIKAASRQSLPSGGNNTLPSGSENKKGFGSSKSSEAEKEAKRARKAERNRRKANAAKRRG